ncbi:MAG TPA: PLP-dependent aminotransferase family protein [Mycobacteriales bacterium]|nr:PLP-dependent aminotransferase family protein [Mycobacteriales bacterium]
MVGTTLDDYEWRYAARMSGMTASEIRALFAVASRPEVVSLAGGMPFTAALDYTELARLVSEMLLERGASAMQYGSGRGEQRLRELICEVMSLESIAASADEVIVTVGSQQALSLLAQVFLDPGDIVLAEGPSYVGALGVFAAAQAEVQHVPMDSDGLQPEALATHLDQLRRQGRRAKFVYLVPNFHNPAGVTLSEDRRDAIVELAEQHDLLIVEDNPYGLLGFEQAPGSALRSRSAKRVIYLGSFSKTFAAGMRVGWIVAPHAVREKLALVTEAQVLCPSAFNQAIVTAYLERYPWQEQLKTFRELYRQRRDAMLTALSSRMPEGVSWNVPAGGFFVWLTLPKGIDSKVMLPRALAHNVAYVPGAGFYADRQGKSQLRLSYCFPSPERISEGIRRFAITLEEEREVQKIFSSNRDTTLNESPVTKPAADRARYSAPGPEVA